MRALDIDVAVSDVERSAVPVTGPLIVAANHPCGILDGLALAHVLRPYRSDLRVLANRALAIVPELADLCFFVDVSDGGSRRSRSGLRGALEWLRSGHALIVFPAGEVAHQDWQRGSTPRDSAWHPIAGRLALNTKATLLPAFIEGHNSPRFYRFGRVHAALRTLLLPREFLRQRGTQVRVRLGSPLPPHDWPAYGRDAARLTGLVRQRVDELGSEPEASLLEAEITNLQPEHHVAGGASIDVFCAPAEAIPHVLHEIGRLRAMTFREAGEDSGRAIDLDRFDRHYLHLFAWDRERRHVAGAYRIGLADEILATHGIDGLYTATLFRYDPRLLDQLPPALELGRAFVRREYQRRSNALMLLWKGVAQVAMRAGKYRVLFGAVSVSSQYDPVSQQLLREFLVAQHGSEMAALVSGLNPPSAAYPSGGACPTRPAMPVLLRQYLQLNARVLGFNVDRAFGGALDVLMMVDLADVDPAILRRYFGGRQSEVANAGADPRWTRSRWATRETELAGTPAA